MRNLRVYLATQIGCGPCEETKKVLGMEGSKGEIQGVPIYEVDLSTNPERREKMGVTATPTIFIVEGEDENGDGFWEEDEEKHVWHQTGMIGDKANLESYVKALKEGHRVSTPIGDKEQ